MIVGGSRRDDAPDIDLLEIAFFMSVNLVIDAEIPAVKDEHLRSGLRASGFIESWGLVQIFAVGSAGHAGIRLIRNVDSDKVFFSGSAIWNRIDSARASGHALALRFAPTRSHPAATLDELFGLR